MRTRSNGGIIGVFNNTSAYGANGFWYATDAATLAINYKWPIPPLGVIPFNASGGTTNEYFANGVYYRAHTFSSSGTFTIGQEPGGIVDLLLIGGGGGGGSSFLSSTATATIGGGGGGGGGFLEISDIFLPPGNYTVTVGQGGAGGTVTSDPGDKGANTSFIGVSVQATVMGGGGGASAGVANSSTSGATGGGSRGLTAISTGAIREIGSPSANTQQGYAGGSGYYNYNGGSYMGLGGSGGGAGSIGQGPTGTLDENWPPGDGLYSSITGTQTGYGGGGYGGYVGAYALFGTHVAPAAFGGGSLPTQNYTNSTALPSNSVMHGIDGKGGGGAGGLAGAGATQNVRYYGGDGGDGIVIVRYRYQ